MTVSKEVQDQMIGTLLPMEALTENVSLMTVLVDILAKCPLIRKCQVVSRRMIATVLKEMVVVHPALGQTLVKRRKKAIITILKH